MARLKPAVRTTLRQNRPRTGPPAQRMVAQAHFRPRIKLESDSSGNRESESSGSSADMPPNMEDPEDELGIVDDSDDSLGIASATKWTFHRGLKLVLHDVDCCHKCEWFAVHCSASKISLHPSYDTANLAREAGILRDMQERIDGHQSQLNGLQKAIPGLRQKLERIRQEMKTARAGLEAQRTKLEEVRRRLEEARRVRAASGSYTAKSSQHPRSCQSPSPRPHKLLRRGPAATSSNLPPWN